MSTLTIVILAILLLAAPSPGQEARAEEAGKASEATLFVVPHIHWEGAVFKTREEYLEIGLPFIVEALSLLERHPEYRFVLDQVAYVKPFLERYPEHVEAFRKYVKEGRLEMAGATITMQDNNMPSGESFVRHVLYGKRYYRDNLGFDTKVGWGLDTFGHNAQLPQMLKLAGFNSYWFQRGPSNDMPSVFLWEGIDGTRIPAFWLSQTYVDFHNSPKNRLEFDAFARSRYHAYDAYTKLPVHVAMAGTDVAPPEHHLPGMIKQFNEQPDKPFTIRLAVAADYEKAVAERGDRPVFKKELNPIFQGIYSSRIELKQWMREIEGLLTAVEKFGAIARWLGKPADEHALASAWDPVLFNQAHDLASGVMVDKVYDDTKRGYEYARQVGKELLEPYLASIGSAIDTSGEGIPVAVFNTLGWQRNDYVEVQASFAETGIMDVAVVSPSGEKVPAQLAVSERYGDGGIRNVKVAFVAREVPALGYAVFHIVPGKTSSGKRQEGSNWIEASPWGGRSSHRDIASIENETYALTFDLWTGEITKLMHKPSNWEVLGGRPANVVAMEHDGGDFWELYGTLNGARLVAMEKKHGLPDPGQALLSSDNVGGNGRIVEGPVYSQFSIEHPFGSGSFATQVRLYRGIERIDIQTRVFNNEKLVRYRAVFPTSIRDGRNVQEIPFGSLDRPLGLELPAQNWIDYSDGNRGVALLNRGLPGNNVVSDSLVLSLMRSARIAAYAFHGGYEPGVSSDTGLELGKSLTFDYSLMPHAGDWKKAQVYRAGWEFNQPLLARKLPSHKGALPKTWGALEVSHANAVVSAWKPGPEGSTILRVYEASGQATTGVTVRFKPGVVAAHEANLIEDAGQAVPVNDNTIRFDLGPYQIKTFRLQLKPASGS